MKRTTSGFTLIELLVVIVVLGILVAIVTVSYDAVQIRNRNIERQTDITTIKNALEIYYSENAAFPIISGSTSDSGSTWATSNHTASWTSLRSTLSLPNIADPRNTAGSIHTTPTSTIPYTYAYNAGTSGGLLCGVPAGQAFILLYRNEKGSVTTFMDGDCPGFAPLSDVSYVVVVK